MQVRLLKTICGAKGTFSIGEIIEDNGDLVKAGAAIEVVSALSVFKITPIEEFQEAEPIVMKVETKKGKK